MESCLITTYTVFGHFQDPKDSRLGNESDKITISQNRLTGIGHLTFNQVNAGSNPVSVTDHTALLGTLVRPALAGKLEVNILGCRCERTNRPRNRRYYGLRVWSERGRTS